MLCVLAMLAVAISALTHAQDKSKPASGPFGYTLIGTPDGRPAALDFFFRSEDCAVCHERQLRELQGSMHSASHEEPLYRRFAELARKEAGEKIYTFCSGCHAPAGVASGLIPKKSDHELPAELRAGVTCDVCHQISSLTGTKGPWREEGNASFMLQPGRTRFGSTGQALDNRSHGGEKKAFYAKSEFCASCHTVIHPLSGIRIEHTYGEWKSSIYAEKGVQCQDCHMRRVEDAVKVAETLKPIVITGQSATESPPRQIHPHFFAGGNANADRLANGKLHAEMAEARLKSAARIELKLPDQAVAGEEVSFDVVVHNVAAGHNIPTGITELREMWVELRALDSQGRTLYRSGDLDEKGEIRPGAIRFGAVAGNRSGKPTYKPWEMTQFLWKRTIPPKSSLRDRVTVRLPENVSGPVTIEARLHYRSAPPQLLAEVMQNEAFAAKVVEMCRTSATVRVGP